MAGQERTAYSATQAFGLMLITAGLLILLVAALVAFGPDGDIFFVGGVALVAAGGAFIVGRFDATWARIVGLVATVLVFMGTFWLLFGVFEVFSPVEFVAGLAYLLGFVLALVAGVMALVSARKDQMGPTPLENRTRSWVLGIIGVAAVVSVAGFFATRETVSDAEAAGATVIEMIAFEFEPDPANVSAGGNLLVANKDPFVHDFTLAQLDIALDVGPGSEVLIDVSAAAPGTYDYFCTLHSSGPDDSHGMRGSFTIGS